VDNAKAKQIGFLVAAKVNVAKVIRMVHDAQATLVMVQTEITNNQKCKSVILSNLEKLSTRSSRRYTREMHRLDQIILYLKELGEDRRTARYLLDRARLTRRKCEEILADALDD
jgi:hypothetical protein